MCRRPAAKQAVSGVSPVIIASWWLLSFSSRSAGSLSGHCGGGKGQADEAGSPIRAEMTVASNAHIGVRNESASLR